MLINTFILISLSTLIEAIIPVYAKCNGTIILNALHPAASLWISFRETFYYGKYYGTSRKVPDFCSVQIQRTRHDDSIGALLVGRPVLPRECLSGQDSGNQPCNNSTMNIHYRKFSSKTTYVPFFKNGTNVVLEETRRYNNYRDAGEGNIVDTNIEAESLNITWDLANNMEGFSIVVFIFCEDDSCPPNRTCEGPSRRCIPDNIICESPYKYCGDGSRLCPDLPSSTTAATVFTSTWDRGPGGASVMLAISLSVVFFVFLFACVCCCCAASGEQEMSSLHMTDNRNGHPVDDSSVFA